ncbi:MAG TPA: hypothetical protein VJ249_05575 [Candidatus Bathyarchaeia archaeon]|nr:hypothetical protein [Candidatus Bathyarchaeia archaeon]
MSERPEKKKLGAEEIKQILGVVSTEVPGLIKSIIASVFSEEAGKSMGKAAAAFYKELKDGGMPDAVAVKMTEDYVGVFTSLGDMLKKGGGSGKIQLGVGKGKQGEHEDTTEEADQRTSFEAVEKEIERRVKQRLAEKRREENEDEEEES